MLGLRRRTSTAESAAAPASRIQADLTGATVTAAPVYYDWQAMVQKDWSKAHPG